MEYDPTSLYAVEKIVRHRKIRNGIGYEYFVKWKNYDSDQNTWIVPENFVVKQMVTSYNKRHNIPTDDASDNEDEDTQSNSSIDKFTAYARTRSEIFNILLPHEDYSPKVRVEKVLDVHPMTADQEEKIALIKWETKSEPEYVPAQWCYIHYPELTIQFFESQTIYKRNGAEVKFIPKH